jgi:hypothetical protein
MVADLLVLEQPMLHVELEPKRLVDH